MIKIKDTKFTIGKKMKDREIAKLCGVTRQTVWNWRHGKSYPSRKNIERLRKLAK
jgi:transcriptional regulator with XRE-family HTH domain